MHCLHLWKIAVYAIYYFRLWMLPLVLLIYLGVQYLKKQPTFTLTAPVGGITRNGRVFSASSSAVAETAFGLLPPQLALCRCAVDSNRGTHVRTPKNTCPVVPQFCLLACH